MKTKKFLYGAQSFLDKLEANGVAYKTKKSVEACYTCGSRDSTCPNCGGKPLEYLVVEYDTSAIALRMATALNSWWSALCTTKQLKLCAAECIEHFAQGSAVRRSLRWIITETENSIADRFYDIQSAIEDCTGE